MASGPLPSIRRPLGMSLPPPLRPPGRPRGRPLPLGAACLLATALLAATTAAHAQDEAAATVTPSEEELSPSSAPPDGAPADEDRSDDATRAEGAASSDEASSGGGEVAPPGQAAPEDAAEPAGEPSPEVTPEAGSPDAAPASSEGEAPAAEGAATPSAPAVGIPLPIVEVAPGRGVTIRNADGTYGVRAWARADLRVDVVQARPLEQLPTTNVEFRRVALFLDGHAFGPHNKLFLQLAFAPRDLGYVGGKITQSPLFDAFMTFDYLRDATVRVGRFKPFYSRQFIAPWGGLSFVDRSLADGEFRLNRDIGVDIGSEDVLGLNGAFAYHVGVFAGQGDLLGNEHRWSPAFTVRLELKPLGHFDAYQEPDLERPTVPKIAMAVAAAYEEDVRHSRGVAGEALATTQDLTEGTFDFMAKWIGFSASGAAFARMAQDGGGSLLPSLHGLSPAGRTGFGGFLQGGYVTPYIPIEFALRAEQTLVLTSESVLKEQGGVSAALSWYPYGHDLKVQADVSHRWIGRDPIGPGTEAARLLVQLTL